MESKRSVGEVPGWFIRALDDVGSRGCVTVEHARVAFRTWGEPTRRGVVLIHGGGAHAGWWDHVAPLVASEYRVAALDLSGHGDSDHRTEYHQELWAREALAVAEAANINGPPVIIGHSMGGYVALAAAASLSDRLAGVIAIDSPIRDKSPEEEAAAAGQAFGPHRPYASRRAALERFRLIPEQPHKLPYIVEHIAGESLKRSGDSWTWKFDPSVFLFRRPGPELLAEVACRVAILRCEHGLVTSDIGAQMYDLLGRVAPVAAIPEAGHHVMLDQPLALVAAIRSLLAAWEHSRPNFEG